MKNNIDISVVIPTHNRQEEIVESLNSILNQEVMPDEVIVVDDGSCPAVSAEIFSSFPSSVKCLLLRNETPKGGNNARNKGIDAASGDYIAFLDDDDNFKKDKIKIVKKEISFNPDIDIFYHPAHIHMVNEGISYISKPYQFDSKEDVFNLLLTQNRIGGTPMVIVKRQTLVNVGRFDEEMPALQDYELWLRLAKNKAKFFFIKEALTDYHYFTKKGSVSKSLSVNSKAVGLIESKYKEDYATLSSADKKSFECWKRKMVIHKSLLNGDIFTAFKCQANLLMFSPSLVNLVSLLLIPFGAKTMFKLKAKKG